MRPAAWFVLPFAASLPAATIELFAGGGYADPGPGVSARQMRLMEPFGVDFDREGNCYIVEYRGQTVKRIDARGNTSFFAGTGDRDFAGDGGPAARAMFFEPHGLLISPDQQMYIADTHNNRVRRIDLNTGIVATVAGTGEAGFGGDGGPAVLARFRGTYAVALDVPRDRLLVADLHDSRIRAVNLKSGVITTLAGNGQRGAPDDGAPATAQPIGDPRAVAVDSAGNVYFIERQGNALRRVDLQGRIRTVIARGSVVPGLNGPKHIAVDRDDNVIIADAENHIVRRYDTRSGTTTTIAGTGESGSRIVPHDPIETQLNRPHGVYVHPSGDIYISDSYNHRILRMRN
jgi:DNA-binding beta-propeller fold protein YncE